MRRLVSDACGRRRSRTVSSTSTADKLYALNADDRSTALVSRGVRQANTSPAVANGVVYVKATDKLYAFNATTGVQLWSAGAGRGASPRLRSPTASSTSAAGTISSRSNALTGTAALDCAGGRRPRRFTRGCERGRLRQRGQALSRFNATTGGQLWSVGTRLPPWLAERRERPRVRAEADQLRVFRATTGAQLWLQPT